MASLSRLTLLLLIFSVLSADALDSSVSEACLTPQYLLEGQTGMVECSFQNFYSVYWYNSTDSEHETPLVALKESSKSGDGYLSGQFDIFPNGSLLINYVTLQNDHFFRVIMLKNKDGDDYVISNVRVYVVVMSKQPHPFIELCEEELFCFTQLGQHHELDCTVSGTRPAANLTWVARDASGDRDVSTEDIAVSRNELYETQTKTLTNFKESDTMALLVCKVLGPPGVIPVGESMVFIENMDKEYPFTEKEQRNVEVGTKLTLVCSKDSKTFIIWKKRNEYGDWSVIINVYFGEKIHSKVHSKDYNLETDGSITVPHVGVSIEGSYMCVYDDNEREVVKMFEVVVFKSPTVIIEGCKPDERCVLNVHRTGNLTCSVIGIRPKVELQWFTLPEKDSKYISFFDHKESAIKNGETYDITMTSQYELVDVTQTRLAVECRVSGWYIAVSALDENIALQFLSDETIPSKSSTWIIPVVMVILVLITSLAAVIVLVKRKKATKPPNELNQSTDPEKELLRKKDNENEVETPSKPDPSTDQETHLISKKGHEKEPTTFLKNALKSRYREILTVLSIPNLSDEKCCVNDFFIDRLFEAYTLEKHSFRQNTETQIYAYNDNFEQIFNKSSRSILIGDLGFGKKTLCLKMAYDWCEEKPPMNCYETLILLNVKDLVEFRSVFEGIRELLLPQYAEENIKEMMENISSGLIILYGFNFLKDKQKKHPNLRKLLSGDLLPKIHVIVVTTPQQIPKNIRPKPREIRLKDIDCNFQEAFITKNAPNRGINMEQINTLITKNPFLYKLCKIPMFWAIYVYVSSRHSAPLDSAAAVLTKMMALSVDQKKEADEDEEQFKKGDKHLGKVAYESIASGQPQSWKLDYLLSELGNNVYERYEQGGLFISDQDGRLKICHQVLFHWYAAYHFDDIKKSEVEYHLKKISHKDVGNVFCFVCGLCPAYAENVFRVVKQNKFCTRELLINCLFEFKRNGGSIEETNACKNLFDRKVKLTPNDTPSDQQSAVQLLETATSFTHIGIDTLSVEDCLQIDDCSENCLRLQSNLKIPPLPYITLLEITFSGKTLNDISPILRYAASCPKLTKLQFESCFLPENFEVDDFPATLPSHLNVFWNPQLKGALKILNRKTRRWNDKFNDEELNHKEYKKLKENFNEKFGKKHFKEEMTEEIAQKTSEVQ